MVKLNKKVKLGNEFSQLGEDDVLFSMKAEVEMKPRTILEDEKENALLIKKIEELEASLLKNFSSHKVELKRLENEYLKLKKEDLQKEKKIETIERSINIKSKLLLLVLTGVACFLLFTNR